MVNQQKKRPVNETKGIEIEITKKNETKKIKTTNNNNNNNNNKKTTINKKEENICQVSITLPSSDSDTNVMMIREVMESYMMGSKNGKRGEDVESVVVAMLHQGACLKRALATPDKSSKMAQKWVGSVNAFVRDKDIDNCMFGLSMFKETLRVCNYEVMIEYQNTWCTMLVDVVSESMPTNSNGGKKKTGNTINNELYTSAMAAVSLLVEKSALWNDTKRSITSNTTIGQFVTSALSSFHAVSEDSATTVVGVTVGSHLASLMALYAYIDALETGIKPFVGRIEAIAYPLVVSENIALGEAASAVISRLSLCMGINTSDIYWGVTMNKITTAMTCSIDRIFQGIPSDRDNVPRDPRTVVVPKSTAAGVDGGDQLIGYLSHLVNIVIPKFDTSPTLLATNEVRAFQGLSSALIRMLSTETVSPCQFPLDSIVKLICRILNVGFNQIKSNPLNEYTTIQQHLIVTRLHVQAYQLLSHLVQVLRKSMLPFIRTISSILLRPLKLVESFSNSTIQQQLFKTIKDVVESLGSSINDSLAGPLVTMLLKMILPYVPEEQQAADVQEKKNKKKGAQPEVAMVTAPAAQSHQTINNTDATALRDLTEHETRIGAIDILESVLLHCGSLLGASVRADLDSSIVSIIIHGQTLILKKQAYSQSSYSCPRYRCRLYACLSNIVMRPIAGNPPVIPYAMRLLSWAVSNDTHHHVRATCVKGVAICESLIHPQCPNLQATLPTSSSLREIKSYINQKLSTDFNQQQSIDQIILLNQLQQKEMEEKDNQQNNGYENNQDDDEDNEEEEDSEDSEEEEKLDISLNDISDDDEDEEEKDITTVTSTSTTTTSMKTNLFDSSMFKSISTTQSLSTQQPQSKPNVSKQSVDVDDDDEDIPDIIDEPPSSDDE